MRFVLPVASLMLACGFFGQSFAAEKPPLTWHTDFETARRESRESDLPLLVHIYGVNCPPCRQMEAEVFHSAEFHKMVSGGFVLVKLESRKNREICEQFGITSIPADIVLSPQDQILFQHEGFRTGEKPRYLAAVTRHRRQPHAAQVAQGAPNPKDKSSGGNRSSRREPPVENSSTISQMTENRPGNRSGTDPNLVRRESAQPASETNPSLDGRLKTEPEMSLDDGSRSTKSKPADLVIGRERQTPEEEDPAQQFANSNFHQSAEATTARPVHRVDWGLDGYCPVTLKRTGQWVAGRDEFTADYEGQTYRFRDAQERSEFLESPDQFAAQGGGFDLVMFEEVRKSLKGSTRFAAFYNGQLYLFYSRESRSQFKKNPARYAKGRQAAWRTGAGQVAL
jgi:YHS domain-containing protein/thiol-disulfide isomerase/thioredoxin